MQIKYVKGDITTIENGCIVHGVNCQGALNSGVAGAIRRKWPMVYTEYRKLFKNKKSRPDMLGRIQTVHIKKGLAVVNAFTQEYYGSDGKRYADLNAVIKCLSTTMQYHDHINIPMIGCGLGGLEWGDVYAKLVAMDGNTTISVYYL